MLKKSLIHLTGILLGIVVGLLLGFFLFEGVQNYLVSSDPEAFQIAQDMFRLNFKI